jgi:hypothetical protein
MSSSTSMTAQAVDFLRVFPAVETGCGFQARTQVNGPIFMLSQMKNLLY